jgi:hypothetical protein
MKICAAEQFMVCTANLRGFYWDPNFGSELMTILRFVLGVYINSKWKKILIAEE